MAPLCLTTWPGVDVSSVSHGWSRLPALHVHKQLVRISSDAGGLWPLKPLLRRNTGVKRLCDTILPLCEQEVGVRVH